MQKERKIGTIYTICSNCANYPVAEEILVDGNPGLIIRDDFNGSVKLTESQLNDLAVFFSEA